KPGAACFRCASKSARLMDGSVAARTWFSRCGTVPRSAAIDRFGPTCSMPRCLIRLLDGIPETHPAIDETALGIRQTTDEPVLAVGREYDPILAGPVEHEPNLLAVDRADDDFSQLVSWKGIPPLP